jgi:hypothetical protein
VELDTDWQLFGNCMPLIFSGPPVAKISTLQGPVSGVFGSDIT